MRRPTARLSDRTRRRSMQPCATNFTTAARRSKSSAPMSPSCNISTSGGNSSTARAKAKQGKGIFPASVTLTADLHSMGQYIQDGERTLFETIISVAKPAHEVVIEAEAENLDGLNFLAGKRISEVNRMAELGVQLGTRRRRGAQHPRRNPPQSTHTPSVRCSTSSRRPAASAVTSSA